MISGLVVVIDNNNNDDSNGNPLMDAGNEDGRVANGEGWEGGRGLLVEDAAAAAASAAYFCFMM